MNTTFKVKTLYNNSIFYLDWTTCEEYEIMGFIFRVGVNNSEPSKVGLFVHKGSYWVEINSYSWSTVEDAINEFIPFFVKKDITDFLLKHFNLNTTREDRRFLVENELLKEEIFMLLKANNELTGQEIANYLNITVQRALALLLQMTNDGIIQKIKTEKRTYFKY